MSRAARVAAFVATLLAAIPLACRAPSPPPPQPRAARVHVDASVGTATVRVEIARTPREQEKGLMERAQLDADAGMLFVFAAAGRHPFWMKNTILPLDLLFIGEDGRVAAIVERSPLGLDSDDGGVTSRYVLEVNRGWARAHGVKPGDRVRFENVLY